MELREREVYRAKRIIKRIKITEIAVHLGCHRGTVGHFENNGYPMSKEKIQKYKEYIDNHEGSELV
ncbi:helix-turn-helix transcriptional regulator [Paenibacillus marchantiae]|uniref:helix-turn-helix domain-containing protein n=1 Tax=Paenibacillus TaxID=44249 RepID=UPI000C17AAEC|nr:MULTISPECIES: helix-turn-helix transcriptional regulator [Paenibacillus]PIH55343.1 transcriptional regulator [Paenibacillus sp. LK1]WDQ30447.1 helix-turn-helix transcriptional regulator [Paenibacillus marchantiae]